MNAITFRRMVKMADAENYAMQTICGLKRVSKAEPGMTKTCAAIIDIMDDDRERTTADVVVRIGTSHSHTESVLKAMMADGLLTGEQIGKGGTWVFRRKQ
jgi:2-hydroxychromene-2-carboxylate isomerase